MLLLCLLIWRLVHNTVFFHCLILVYFIYFSKGEKRNSICDLWNCHCKASTGLKLGYIYHTHTHTTRMHLLFVICCYCRNICSTFKQQPVCCFIFVYPICKFYINILLKVLILIDSKAKQKKKLIGGYNP